MLIKGEFPIKDEFQIFPQIFGGEYETSNRWEIEWRRIEETVQSVEIEDFSFGVFYNKAELIQKFGYYIIVTKEARIGNINQLVLRNKKTIIYKGNDRYRNVKIFKTFFQNIKKEERYKADKCYETL